MGKESGFIAKDESAKRASWIGLCAANRGRDGKAAANQPTGRRRGW